MYSPLVLAGGLAAETAGLSIKNTFCRLFLWPSRCYATRRPSRFTAAKRRGAIIRASSAFTLSAKHDPTEMVVSYSVARRYGCAVSGSSRDKTPLSGPPRSWTSAGENQPRQQGMLTRLDCFPWMTSYGDWGYVGGSTLGETAGLALVAGRRLATRRSSTLSGCSAFVPTKGAPTKGATCRAMNVGAIHPV
jgi:hypothetical protein